MRIIYQDEGWKIIRHDGRTWAEHKDSGHTAWLEQRYYMRADRACAHKRSKDFCEEVWAVEDAIVGVRPLINQGRLRVNGAIHGLSGASPLGALLC
jgi:hypothetical protein